jgi:hypothetical protein
MPISLLPRRALLAAALLASPAALVSCGDEAPASTMTIEVSLSSKYKNLHKVGPDDSVVYGWNDLQGEAVVDGEKVQVAMLGVVQYVNGEGPFGGTVTLTFPDGSKLAFDQVDAKATAKTDTTDARFSGLVRVIGGTGRFAETTGRGVLAGRRNDSLGGVVEMRFVLRLVS